MDSKMHGYIVDECQQCILFDNYLFYLYISNYAVNLVYIERNKSKIIRQNQPTDNTEQ